MILAKDFIPNFFGHCSGGAEVVGFALIIKEVIKGLRCRQGCLGSEFLSSIKLKSFPKATPGEGKSSK